MRLPGGAEQEANPNNLIEPNLRDDIKFDKENNKDYEVKENDECSICFADDVTTIKIHGSHKICSICMQAQLKSRLFYNGDSIIKCPISCDNILSMKQAFTIAAFDKKEWITYELRLNMNAMLFKACPNIKCGTFIFKDFKELKCVLIYDLNKY